MNGLRIFLGIIILVLLLASLPLQLQVFVLIILWKNIVYGALGLIGFVLTLALLWFALFLLGARRKLWLIVCGTYVFVGLICAVLGLFQPQGEFRL